MAYELKQELRLTQSLVMTPQLQLAIKLLQLSRLELVETIREELQTNPVIEDTAETGAEGEPAAKVDADEGKKSELDWQSYIESSADYGGSRLNFSSRSDAEDDDYMASFSASSGGLAEHLMWQFKMSAADPGIAAAGEFIIGNIAEDGYLKLADETQTGLSDDDAEVLAVAEVARHTGVSLDVAEKALSHIQQFDPPGVGARTLRECLLIQARQLPVRDTLVEEIISRHLGLLARKNYKAVSKLLGITVDSVAEAARLINKCLNPVPGAGFGADEAKAIVPDVYIHKAGDNYVITLNEDGLPKLRISPYYAQILKSGGTMPDDAKEYIQEKRRSALWLINSVYQRQNTIKRVVECIVRFQRDFLDKGLQFLRPMILREVAEGIGMHESTVSRVTSNKYVQTPRGIFELKYFFSTGMATSDGGDVATEYVREKLMTIIKGENPQNPFSDIQIVEELKKDGIILARRTAAKYRETLGIQPSNRRRMHY